MFMSTSSVSTPQIPRASDAPAAPRRVSLAVVLTGLALGGSMAFGLMWQSECQRVKYLQAQIEPLKAEATRYRVGLQEEIARTMRLAEELRIKQAESVSAR